MGVSSLPNRITYAGNGSSTSFNFPYYFFFTTDLLVFKYDTILGGVTAFALGVDYTISGTQNTQGLYPSGANVVATVAPLSTDMIVIVREPQEVQNYTLLQNGNISSTAIVQQFDYVTLLIQKLQDQVNRSMYLADGTAPAFNGALPTNIALQPGASPMVNAAGNGWVLGSPAWNSVIIPFSSLQTAGLTKTVTAFSLPPGFMLNGVVVKTQTAFAGTSITSLLGNVGVSGDTSKFIGAYDLRATVSDTNFDYDTANLIASWANATTVQLAVTAIGANLSALSAGSLAVYYSYSAI